MTDTYRVFSRNPWKKVNGKYQPNLGACKRTLAKGLSLDDARRACATGPANLLRAAGKEYRHAPFHELEKE